MILLEFGHQTGIIQAMVIGLAGFAQSGKDTLFHCLNKHGKGNYRRYAFADALKDQLADRVKSEFGWDIYNLTKEQKDIVRPLMLELGAGKRKEDPLHWVNILYTKILEDQIAAKTPFNAVITDVRYMNEASFFASKFPDFKLVAITRFGNVAANPEEETYTTPLYIHPNAIQFAWSSIDIYAEEDLDCLISSLEFELFS